MERQNQINRTLSQPEAIESVRRILCSNQAITRTELVNQLCDRFGFFDPRGKRQRAGCIKALRELERKKQIVLPAGGGQGGQRRPRRLAEGVAEAKGVPGEVSEIREIEIVRVETAEQMRIWNEIMIEGHPRGAGPLVGRQLYYLVKSEHGWLGGFGFGSSAIHLEARDRWIGWDWEARRANLHHVVNMSRFLIRPGISCKNLASRVLGMVVRGFPGDFEARYGHRPLLLESFVDTSHYRGVCYRAANWQYVGRTKGRGRQDVLKKAEESIKDIYVYPLDENFRGKMGLPEGSGREAIDITAGIEGGEWAEKEFGGARLGDKRLSRRLVEIAVDKAEEPGRSFSGVADGEWPRVKGYYRFIDKPDDSAVTMSAILQPHRERTIQRMKAEKTVLCIQDGSDLNYSTLERCEGLGTVGTNQTGKQSGGLHLHSTFVVTTEGLPLGVLRAECTAREAKPQKDARPLPSIPIEEKNTFSWIAGVRDCRDIKPLMPGTKLVSVMDREADFFELFDDHRRESFGVELLIRAYHNRKTTGNHKLFDEGIQSPVQAQITIKIQRQSARVKNKNQKARDKRDARTAEVSVRYIRTELKPPPYFQDMTPIPLWVIHVKEENPPAGTKAIEWFLLTTIDIKTKEDALECIRWYCLRWRIEDWHRVLKSGCAVEDLAHKTAERLKRAIAINLVIAWRIMLMTLLGRETPELPPEVMFSDIEIKVLQAYAKKKAFTFHIV